MRARIAFIVGQRAEYDSGFRGCGGGWRRRSLRGRRRGALRRRRLGHGLRLRFRGSANDAAFDLLDHDLLGAAMAEALAHDALLDAAL